MGIITEKNKGQVLWQRAVHAIPGGNGLLSKRPDRYAPDIWPCYFSKAKGVELFDLDGRKYIDMAQMGLGSAILGYSNDEVDGAVKEAISSGVNTTLNTPEEVYLAEKLLELNPFAGGVRFARTGGEAMAIAVRIARAASGRDKVAISGYHGWCDWYLAANIGEATQLDNHLLPGLTPVGVPKALGNTVLTFTYNDVDALAQIIDNNPDIGVICVEGARYDFPNRDFLEALEYYARQRELVIISDEITSGWRFTDGGIYKVNGFSPDIVVYGKALGNGYAISAVVGNKETMDNTQDSFISSTFWTERVGFVAALKTIEVLTRDKVWEHLNDIGTKIGKIWLEHASKHDIRLSITDCKPLITMKLDYGSLNQAVVTYYIQEMLKRGYLAAPSVYVSKAHTAEGVDKYAQAVDEVFGLLSQVIAAGDLEEKLLTKPRTDAFKRLTA